MNMRRNVVPPSSSEDDELTDRSLLKDDVTFESSSLAPQISRKRLNLLLPLASSVASLGGVLFGYDIGIISGALLQLKAEFSLTCVQQEFVVASLLVGGLIGSVTGGFLLDRFGRKITIIVNAMMFITGAVVLSISPNYAVLVVGRMIVGFAVSLSAVSDCVYISEIAPPAKRGLLVSINEFGITLGILLAYLVSFLLIDVKNGWRYMFAVSCLPALLQMVGMVFLSESPRWLISKGCDEKALQIIGTLWPYVDSRSEVTSIKESISSENNYSLRDLFSTKEKLRTRMFIGCGLVLFQQLSGQPTVIYYAPTLFQTLGFSSGMTSSFVTVGLGLVKVVFTFVTLCTVDRLGRRTFLLVGAVVMTISVITLSSLTEGLPDTMATDRCELMHVSVCLNQTSFNATGNATCVSMDTDYPQPIRYLCALALMLFVVGYAVGYGPVTWLILTEIFPTGIKGRAVSIASSVNWGSSIFLSMTFLEMIGKLGPFYTFLIYSLIGMTSIMFIWHVVPETKSKSLETIGSDLKERSLMCRAVKCCLLRSVDVTVGNEDDNLLSTDVEILEDAL